jgi:hypothetical protein
MKKYFSKGELSSFSEQAKSIQKDPQYFQALLTLYDKLYTEILSWGIHAVNLSIGSFFVLFTGIFYGIVYSRLCLIALPPLFGLLCISSILIFLWMSTLAYKMAEIEVFFKKLNKPLFNWLTKHNLLSPSRNSTHGLVIFIIIIYLALFVLSVIYTFYYKEYFRKIEIDSKLSTEFNLENIVLAIDGIMLFSIAIFIAILFNKYSKVRIKVKQLDDHLSKTALA